MVLITAARSFSSGKRDARDNVEGISDDKDLSN